MAKKEVQQTLEEALKDIEKQYGRGSVINGNEITEEVEVIDTGSIGLNKALGCGGWPMGKIIDLYGWESAGRLEALCQLAVLQANPSRHHRQIAELRQALEESRQ